MEKWTVSKGPTKKHKTHELGKTSNPNAHLMLNSTVNILSKFESLHQFIQIYLEIYVLLSLVKKWAISKGPTKKRKTRGLGKTPNPNARLMLNSPVNILSKVESLHQFTQIYLEICVLLSLVEKWTISKGPTKKRKTRELGKTPNPNAGLMLNSTVNILSKFESLRQFTYTTNHSILTI